MNLIFSVMLVQSGVLSLSFGDSALQSITSPATVAARPSARTAGERSLSECMRQPADELAGIAANELSAELSAAEEREPAKQRWRTL